MTGAATPGLPGSPSTPFLDGLFAAVLLDDAQLAPFFDGLDLAKLKAHQQAFIAAAIGGPDAYEGREMREAHDGLDISDRDFDRVVGHLVATLTSLNVPPETIGAIGDKLSPLKAEIVTAK